MGARWLGGVVLTALATTAPPPRLLVTWRPLSRNLEGFGQELPGLPWAELTACYDHDLSSDAAGLTPVARGHHVACFHSPTFMPIDRVIAAARTSIMLHGMYTVLVDATSTKVPRQPPPPPPPPPHRHHQATP